MRCKMVRMIAKLLGVLVLGLLLVCFSACGSAVQTPGNKSVEVTIRTDAEELAKKVKLPVQPSKVKWVEKRLGSSASDRVPGPSDHMLIAQLYFDDAGKKRLLETLTTSEARADSIDIESWFDDEVKAKQIDRNGHKMIAGPKLSADAILLPPYSNATLINIPETNIFILKIWTS